MLSCAGPAEEAASAARAVTDCLPPAYVDCLLDTALEPVLDAAVQRGGQAAKRKKTAGDASEVAKALLAVTVCDPACGSGGLLIAAARRIARRVAQAREGNQSADALRRAMREVVGTCVYGVDVSGEAVERTKDRLRIAADVPGMTPPFLDGHVRQGNALIGASPELIEGGVPDEAFRPADGDDRRYARSLRRANARPDPGQATLFSEQGGDAHSNEALAKSLAKIGRPRPAPQGSVPQGPQGSVPQGSVPQDSARQESARPDGEAPADDGRQAAEYRKWRDSAAFRAKRLVADAWCAAFAWAKTPDAPPAIVNRVLLDLREREAEGILPETLAEILRLRGEHRFFHWHLEFPDVFRVREGQTRWQGGFNCVLSAPPQEKIDRREGSAVFGFATRSGAYPDCAAGLAEPGGPALRADLLFAERVTALLAPEGRAGCVVASATAAAPSARHLLGAMMRRGELASLYDFPGPGARLCLLTIAAPPIAGGPVLEGPVLEGPVLEGPVLEGPVRTGTVPGSSTAHSTATRFAFWLDGPAALGDDGRTYTLTPGEAALINPNTGALPAFRGARDAALIAAIYRRVPALCNESRRDEAKTDGNPWRMRLATAFPRAMAGPGLLRAERELRDEGWEPAGSTFTRDGQRMLPVYEPPMIDLFDHEVAKPRHWIAEHGPVAVQRKGETAERPGVADRLAELGWNWEWLCAWRAPVSDRTAVAVLLPRAAAAGSLPLMLPRVVPPFAAALIAAQSSLVFEYVARQKVDGPVVRAADWKQLPVPAPDTLDPHLPFIVPRVLELVCTSSDMSQLARDLDDTGDPFAWEPDRRASLRAELDAFFFRVYGVGERRDVEYIIDTLLGDDGGRTRELILAAYDRMTEADAAGADYQTRIFPPPGHGPRRQRS
jgi:hypothetical protein